MSLWLGKMLSFISSLFRCQVLWGLSLVGRASDLHSEGQEFESPSLHNAVIAQLVRAQH